MYHRLINRFFTLITLIVLLAGCDTINSALVKSVAEKPELSVQGLKVTGISLSSVSLLLTLKVQNPNSYKLAISGYDYQIALDDKKILDGSDDKGFSVPAKDSSTVELPLTIGFIQAKELLASIGTDNQLKYDVKAKMKLAAPVLNLLSINAGKQGSIEIPQLPDVSFGNLDVKNISFTEASFILTMNVTNPNKFGMDIKDIDYTFSVAGEPWFSGALDQTIQLTQNQTTTVKIPLKVGLNKLGSGLLSALRNGTLSNYSLDANVTVDSGYEALKNLRVPLHYTKE